MDIECQCDRLVLWLVYSMFDHINRICYMEIIDTNSVDQSVNMTRQYVIVSNNIADFFSSSQYYRWWKYLLPRLVLLWLLENDCEKSFVATLSYFSGTEIESCKKIQTAVVGERALGGGEVFLNLYKKETLLNINKMLKGGPISFWRRTNTNTARDIPVLLQKAKNLVTE